MEKRSGFVFSTTKNRGFLAERKCSARQMGRLLKEIGAKKEYTERGDWPEYFQSVHIIGQPIFLTRILKTKIRRGEFSFRQVSAPKISGERQNKERNCYNQKNLFTFESFLHV